MKFLQEFKETPVKYRPKMRWWLPGSITDPEQMAYEIKMMKDAGFAGTELSPDWFGYKDKFMQNECWGSSKWYELLKKLLLEAQKQELEVDFSMISSAPLAVPNITDVNDPAQGAQMELNGAFVDGITKENPYDGPLPVNREAIEDAAKVDGKVVLHAVTVAKYVDKEKKILSFASASELDLAKVVEKTGENDTSYHVKFIPEDEGEYVLFAWWQHPSGSMVGDLYQIDHYGKAGTRKIIAFYEEEVLPALGEARSGITSLFVDSLEYNTHLDYTIGMREMFIEKNGYDFTKYLPAVYEQEWYGMFYSVKPDFCFDEHNEQLKHSFYNFLTEIHIENHLEPLQEFCQRNGMTLRYQTAYGKLLELARTAGYVDIPETETLYGKDFVDFYRAQAGSVHITGKKVYSIEASAECAGRGNGDCNSGNYEQGFKKHLWHLQRAYAGGVNQVYFHGLRYRGHYHGEGNENGALPGTHWPGHEPMGRVNAFANSWDDRQPNWNGMKQLTDYITRCQYTLQTGKTKVDLAVYRHSYFDVLDCYDDCEKIFQSTVLEQLGYSYDFISPFHLTECPVEYDGKGIFSDGPAYKALVIHDEKDLPVAVVKRLLELTKQGLPVIICGGVPNESTFFGEEEISNLMGELLQRTNVCVCDCEEQIPAMLEALKVTADASYPETAKVLNLHHQDEDMDLFYFYNYTAADTYPELADAEKTMFTTRLGVVGDAYILDPWTGSVIKAEPCCQDENSMMVTLEIAPNDARILMIVPSCKNHVIAEPKKQMQYEKAVSVKNWTLEVESWTEGKNALDTAKDIVKKITLEDPIPWTQIQGMENISGVGYYRTQIELEEGWEDGVGAYLGAMNIEDCYNLKVNGAEVPANQVEPLVDIGRYLNKGVNIIEVAVSSTLLNACIQYDREHGLLKDHAMEQAGKIHFVECGMWGPVTLIPYTWSE